MDFQVKSQFELKEIDEQAGIVTGYCAIFNVVDSDRDIILPGAFAKTLLERGPGSAKPRIKHLWQHDSWVPIGIPRVLREDEKGLYFETVFGKDTVSRDKLQQHIDGIITEMSFGYNVMRKEEFRNDTGELDHRNLIELKMWEYSSVTWGAQQLTEIISAKGVTADVLANLTKRLDALNRGLKNGKYTDETAEQFEAEIEKIQSIIKSLPVTTAPPDEGTQGDPAPVDADVLKQLLTILKTK